MTLREHLEAIRSRCRPIPKATPAENQAFEHAVAALKILDDAQRVGETYYEGPYPAEWIEIHDPEQA